VVKAAEIGGRLEADVVGFGTAGGLGSETGGGFNRAGRADGQKDGAVIESEQDFVEVEGSFAEPADVRADLAAAFAARDRGRLLVELHVVERRAGARVAARFEKFTMHVDDAARACLFLKIVDILGTDEETVLESRLEGGDGLMGGIGFGVRGNAAAHGVEVPDEMGIAAPGMGRGDFFETIVAPEPVRIAERGDAAFGGHTRAREKEEAVRGGQRQSRHSNQDTRTSSATEETRRGDQKKAPRSNGWLQDGSLRE